jgi:hypothetical protein
MGYRSTVTYAIYAPEKVLMAKLAAWRLTGEHAQALAECSIGTDEGDGYITFEVNDVKWYASYEDVAIHERLWEALDQDGAFTGAFVRFGEDDNDIEYRTFGDGEPLLRVTREIETDVPQFKPFGYVEESVSREA